MTDRKTTRPQIPLTPEFIERNKVNALIRIEQMLKNIHKEVSAIKNMQENLNNIEKAENEELKEILEEEPTFMINPEWLRE